GRPLGPVPDAGPQAAGNTLLTSSAAEVATARAQLGDLRLGPRPGLPSDYRRAAFGEAWTDTDGNGCNQRDDVLLRDRVASQPYRVGRQGSCDHDVLAGTWVDPYTGATIVLTDAKEQQQAQSVQIDHVVALSVAWRYGAATWTDGQRLAFANDLRNLVAAGGAANQAKGGADASQWQPVRAARCGYAVRYVTVKSAYALPTDAAEKAALASMLDTCGP
ncbi:HNH endonuclease family protein, partial [Propionicimonas sp.]|uniref:HNH endonuclease family protein n=1 Tax=Propionicimonas sp. TaxID=1955623 RepID=UPI0039E32694